MCSVAGDTDAADRHRRSSPAAGATGVPVNANVSGDVLGSDDRVDADDGDGDAGAAGQHDAGAGGGHLLGGDQHA